MPLICCCDPLITAVWFPALGLWKRTKQMNKLWYRPPPLIIVNGQITNLGSRQFSEQRLRKIVSKLCQRTCSTYTVNLNILSQIEIFASLPFQYFPLLTCLKEIETLQVWAICWIVGELASVGSLPLRGKSNVRTKGSKSWEKKN